MNHVHRLPPEVADQIAAGEVVERPASVVKELVENALDAGARTVKVELAAGGKALVRVADDGSGMGREDARLALERHATSKLRELADLEALSTHGFRGEALPSIASVSHLVLRTRDDASTAGSEIEVRDGRVMGVRDAGHPRGTTVEVRDLFGGVPARRKFLRADSTETAHATEALTLLALARPETGFHLLSAGRTLVRAPPVSGLDDRIYQLFGGELLENLVPLEDGGGLAAVHGYVARPGRRILARPSLRLFVNRRAVRDRALARAVSEAYRRTGAEELRGEAFVFVEVPPHLVDVNVHPAKAEVRFADARVVWTAVEEAVATALSRAARRSAPAADTARLSPPASATEESEPVPRVAEPAPVWMARGAKPRLIEGGPLTLLGQHRLTYLVATDGEDLLLVDQHTAHERVHFEAIVERLSGRSPESQMLLAPLVVTPPPPLRPVLEANVEGLRALGYDLEPFGGESWRLRAVPAVLPSADPVAAMCGILQDLLERADETWEVEGPWPRLAATLACHSSVRAAQPLKAETMAAILRELPRTQHPALCPHGRPTMVRLPQREVSRWFERTGWKRR